MEKININKLIALRSKYSRRQAEDLVRQGLVKTRKGVVKLGETFSQEEDIFIKGIKLEAKKQNYIYLKLNKPPAYTCTQRIFPGEKNVFSLLPFKEKLFIMGRLDKDSRGLLILSNDGDLVHKVTHPSFSQTKKYLVSLATDPRLEKAWWIEKIKKSFKEGVFIQEKSLAQAVEVKYLAKAKFKITLSQGQKRQVRRMFDFFNFKVKDLKRVEIAGVKVGKLKEGAWEYLSPEDLLLLKKKS